MTGVVYGVCIFIIWHTHKSSFLSEAEAATAAAAALLEMRRWSIIKEKPCSSIIQV